MKHLSLLGLALAIALSGCSKDEAAPAKKPAAAAPAPAPEAKATADTEAKAEEPAEQPLEKATVVLWHAYRAEEQKALEQLVDAYNAKGGPVTIDAIPVPYDAFVDKIGITVPRGNGPDLFIFAHNMIGDWSKAGLIEPLSQWAPPELLAQFIPDTVKALVYNKSLYGLPLAFKSLVLFYNKAMVKEAPKTTSELIAAAKANTGGEKVGLAYESAKLYFHAPWLHAFGGAVFDEAGKPAIDSEASVKATELARSLVKEHGVVPSGMTTFMVSSLFNEGKAAMALSGPWFRGDIAPGIDYGVAVLPTVDGAGPAKPFLSSEAVFVSAKSGHKREAFDVARFLASDESARVRATVGKQPVANKATYDDPEVAKDAAMAVFLEQTKNAVITPASPEMQVVWSTYDAALNRVLFGDADAKGSLTEAQQKAESDISKIAK
jgi:arabinogalactan oligomer/maltooligosaccharide transport system substrate-binding protein